RVAVVGVEEDARARRGRLKLTTLCGRTPWRRTCEEYARRQDAKARTHQKVKRMAICIVLGSLASVVIVPSVLALARSRFGRPKFTVLNRLKISHRRMTPFPEERRI